MPNKCDVCGTEMLTDNTEYSLSKGNEYCPKCSERLQKKYANDDFFNTIFFYTKIILIFIVVIIGIVVLVKYTLKLLP